jgi:predicted NUDIX family phosphoesterase
MEFVYVVPRRDLFPDAYPQGFQLFSDPAQRARLERTVGECGFFVEREAAERNPEWKQIIPYSVLVQGDRTLLMRRLAAGGEKRLHNKLSIGVGGHINPEDLEESGPRNPIEAGTRREISEELVVDGSFEIRTLGLLNDDSNPVGAVHLGWVQVVTIEGSVRIREEDVLEGKLTTFEGLRKRLRAGDNFETWSSILIERLDELLPHFQPMTTSTVR